MGEVRVEEIDRTDPAQLRRWWEVGQASSAGRPFGAWPAWEVSRVALPMPRTDGDLTLFVAREDGRVVGAASLFVLLLDNTHLGEVDVHVLPQLRRHGIGRLLLAEVETAAREAGRTTTLGSAFAPIGAESPGSLFAAALGYLVASAEETKIIDLAVAMPGWGALDDEVAAGLGDHGLAVFESRVPDEWVDDFCGLLSGFITSIPLGDLAREDAAWTVGRLREGEERAIAVGRTNVMAVGIAPDGHLCGFSDLRVNQQDARHGAVGGTLVLPEHRGHRLGLGMKLLTHRRALELFPGCAYVETGNAGVNAAMSAVNQRLGYRVVERSLDVQKVLGRPSTAAERRG